MIDISHIVPPSSDQMDFIIEGMRNPKNSWDRSDSYPIYDFIDVGKHEFHVGQNDYKLMKQLNLAGIEHRKFMRMMPLYMRITAPLYWWKEFDTYKVGTTSNSCSTMHKITFKKFDISDFSVEHLNDGSMAVMKTVIAELEIKRQMYLQETDPKIKKDIWWQIIQLLPSSYNQTRNISLNYEVATDIYKQRKNHKLDEWREFCNVLETIPFHFLITGNFREEDE